MCMKIQIPRRLSICENSKPEGQGTSQTMAIVDNKFAKETAAVLLLFISKLAKLYNQHYCSTASHIGKWPCIFH